MFKKLTLPVMVILLATFSAPTIMGDWVEADGHKMHHPQFPNVVGWDVNATNPVILADDFMCGQTGWIKDIHFWGSWMHGFEGQIVSFNLSIHEDIPADPPDEPYSMPGITLWEREITNFIIAPPVDPPGMQGWYDPTTGEFIEEDHEPYFQYNVFLPEADWFWQEEGTIYWLNITATVTGNQTLYVPGDIDGDGDVDWDDYYYFEDYILYAGPPPPYSVNGFYPSADVNGDCVNSILDVVELVDWLNGMGPPPSYCPQYPPSFDAQWGVKSTLDHWNDDAVWAYWGELFWIDIWEPPDFGISLDLAFVITGGDNPLGACCYEDGSCADMTQSNCVASGGTWQGPGTICLGDGDLNGIDDACEGAPQTGACCYADGTCAVVTQAACVNGGGTYQGDGSPCLGDMNGNLIDDACEGLYNTGACCFIDGSCVTTSLGACVLAGGNYKGDGTACQGDGDMNGIDDACEVQVDSCEYYKAPYDDYAPYGMPDFDQKQNNWIYPPSGAWSHCGPVALANCFWWFDSQHEPNPVDPTPFWPGPGNPPLNDGYGLVSSFGGGAAGWDDHDTNNVMPFIDSLAKYCLTNTAGSGTNVFDLAQGAQDWLDSVGLGDKYLINTYMIDNNPYDFNFIRDEVLRSQDVILLLGFWQEVTPGFCERSGGHYVTVAGTCIDPLDSNLCISDPFFDMHEGEPPPGSAHGASVHNDAANISGPHGTMYHDKYFVGPNPCSPFAPPVFTNELLAYPAGSAGPAFSGQNNIPGIDPITFNPGFNTYTIIEYAVVICSDKDGDGWSDDQDNCPDTYNPDQANSDGDSHGDACDNCPNDDNENQNNYDGDSHGDVCDNCLVVDNEDQANNDADSHGDACDNCPNDDNENQNNYDGDSHGDVCDNCPTDDNETQTNSDADSHGDACDNCPNDNNENQNNYDGDSHGDACDNCPTDDNETQTNSDADSHGDICDNCPTVDNETQTNSDADSHGDICDNCPDDDNEDQADADGDGIGDVCEEFECDCVPGNSNGDAATNILDITYIIAYLYKGGPPPTPYVVCSADANCDCRVNILDTTYLIAYLYRGGPPPCACEEWLAACGPPLHK